MAGTSMSSQETCAYENFQTKSLIAMSVQKHLTTEQRAELMALKNSGVSNSELAVKFNKPVKTIWAVVYAENRKHQREQFGDPRRRLKPGTEFQEMDLSSLPDNVLFSHINYDIP